MRILASGVLAALDDGNVAVRRMVLFDLPEGRFGFWDDVYDITYSGDTYVGSAGIVAVDLPPSSSDLAAHGLRIVISGLDASVTADVEAHEYHQRPVEVSDVYIDPDTRAVLQVKRVFVGFIDQVERQEKVDGESRLVIPCESMQRELDRTSGRTRSDADQQALFAGDGFFRHTTNATSTDIEWGNIPPQEPRRRKLFGIF